MTVGADTGVGVGEERAVGALGGPDRLGRVLQIDLVDDAGARWHDLEVVQRLRPPFQELVALAIALILHLDILLERLRRAELVHHDGMVDDEVAGHLRIDLLGVAAEPGHRVAHGGEIDDAGHAGEVLHHHARRAVLDFAVDMACLGPVDDRLRVLHRGRLAVFMPQHVFQQHLQ